MSQSYKFGMLDLTLSGEIRDEHIMPDEEPLRGLLEVGENPTRELLRERAAVLTRLAELHRVEGVLMGDVIPVEMVLPLQQALTERGIFTLVDFSSERKNALCQRKAEARMKKILLPREKKKRGRVRLVRR